MYIVHIFDADSIASAYTLLNSPSVFSFTSYIISSESVKVLRKTASKVCSLSKILLV